MGRSGCSGRARVTLNERRRDRPRTPGAVVRDDTITGRLPRMRGRGEHPQAFACLSRLRARRRPAGRRRRVAHGACACPGCRTQDGDAAADEREVGVVVVEDLPLKCPFMVGYAKAKSVRHARSTRTFWQLPVLLCFAGPQAGAACGPRWTGRRGRPRSPDLTSSDAERLKDPVPLACHGCPWPRPSPRRGPSTTRAGTARRSRHPGPAVDVGADLDQRSSRCTACDGSSSTS